MGLMARIMGMGDLSRGIGSAVSGVSEVFVPNATKRMLSEAAVLHGAMGQFGAEFSQSPVGWFDRFVNGINRLPRPSLAMGTLGLFVYAMVSPAHFATRMQGLALVPDQMWWLLGAIVSFYFGAREMHHIRGNRARPPTVAAPTSHDSSLSSVATSGRAPSPVTQSDNAAVDDWKSTRRR